MAPTPTILITGATGLVGNALVPLLAEATPSRRISVLTRKPERIHKIAGVPVQAFGWSPSDGQLDPRALEGVTHVIHLAGEPVAQRWTAANKQRIRDSRTGGLQLLRAACMAQGIAPKVISASAVGIYAPGPELRTEDADRGPGFLADVVADWETATSEFGALGGGYVSFRIGLVLSARGGVLQKLLPIYRLGLGAPLASGRQFQSWIHVSDLAKLFATAVEREDWTGPFNAVAPSAVSQRTFSETLAKVLQRPHLLPPVPSFALKLVYGDAAAALLASHNVSAERIMSAGFDFEFEHLEAALLDAIQH